MHAVTLQQLSAHELLQTSLMREAEETCGFERVFDLYWKHKLKKDKQLSDRLISEQTDGNWNKQ